MRMSVSPRNIALLITIVGLLVQGPLYARDSPSSVLDKLVTNDLAGNMVGRHGLVIFTNERESDEAACDCSVPKDSFDPRGDPIVIVTGPADIVKEQNNKTSATFDLVFRVIAITQGSGEDPLANRKRTIVPLHPPASKPAHYRLEMRGGKWFVINPPIPRVGIDAVLKTVHDEISAYSNIRRPTYEQTAILRWLRTEEKTLERLDR